MVLEALADHRRSGEPEVLAALRAHDPLALAEAYYRTVGAAQAIGRRLLGPGRESEALLRAVYRRLWEAPPERGALEGWVRGQAFALAAEYLRAVGRPAATRSAAGLLPDLGEPAGEGPSPLEDALAALDAEARSAVLRAHDRGQAPDEGDAEAAAALDRGLTALAGPVPAPGEGDEGARPHLGAWTLGLLEPGEAARVTAAVVADPGLSARAATLRRGRRRLEGLPPGSDVGQRVLAAILAPLPPAGTVTGTGAQEPAAPDPVAGTGGAAPPGAADTPVRGAVSPAAVPGDGGAGPDDQDVAGRGGPGPAADPAAPAPSGRRARRKARQARGLGPAGNLAFTLGTLLGLAAIVMSTPR